jgi:hypothetical protein
VHHLGADRLEQLPVVEEAGHAVPVRGGRGADRVGVADAGQVDAVQVLDRLQVDDRHVAAPDHRGRGHFTPPAVSPPTR